jgi:hypothetical protein
VGAELIHGTATLTLAEGVSHDLHDSDTVLGHGAHDHSPEFSAWLARQRERRNGRLRHALAELSDMAERAQDHADALVHAQELLALEPQSEAAHRRVIRLHYLRGDRAAALLAFDRCEQVLKDEVGARPAADTLALLATIERAAPDATVQPAAMVPAALQRPPRLIGRDTERRALARALEEGGVRLLTGQAGMGKSRLIAELVDGGAAAVDTSRCLSVCARPGDAAAPFALAGRLLRGLTLRADVQLTAGQRDALACVLPELGPPTARARQDDRARLLGAMQSLLDAATRRGLRAVVIDDLQYADAASVELLHALAGSNLRLDHRDAARRTGPAARAFVDAHAASMTMPTPPRSR